MADDLVAVVDDFLFFYNFFFLGVVMAVFLGIEEMDSVLSL